MHFAYIFTVINCSPLCEGNTQAKGPDGGFHGANNLSIDLSTLSDSVCLRCDSVQHEFCHGKAQDWWSAAQTAMTPEQFQDFLDCPMGVNFGLAAMMNICKAVNVELAGNNPYPRKF